MQIEKFTDANINTTDISTSLNYSRLNGLKRNYVMLEDTVQIFDSKSLLQWEEYFSADWCVCY